MVANPADKTVFEWNMEGVACLQRGQYSDAIANFRTAMAGLRMVAQDAGGFRLHGRTGYGSQANNPFPEDVSIVSVSVVREDVEAYETVQNDLDTTLIRMFGNAFTTVFTNYQGVRGMQLTISFVLYNLAVCVHHRELSKVTQGEAMNPENLRKALHLYTRSLRAISAALGDGRMEDVIVLLMAIYNNMGNLYSYFGSPDDLKLCLLWIRSLLATYQQYVQPQRHTLASDVPFFQLNVVSVPDTVFHKAAAA
ncbi:expressed unknown protein [Seminavis robusta]|uniref:Uncharacterized protein n=1 Tax=Seminavis robusta TaxID=568900 RepID=A0A9N8EF94_9STRA|nr:expressed unknown protein [Seminavis robusta]|eukprot:Sro1009_g230670.1 n/a (252) ;mRNA; f:8446-9201